MNRLKDAAVLIAPILLFTLLLVSACDDGGDGDDHDECTCDFTHLVDEDGLSITFESQGTSRPANVSVLFKVETEEGMPVTGLTAGDFRIFENGELISDFESQQAILPKPGMFRSHILLLLDLSGSVLESESLSTLKEAARTFVYAIMPAPYAVTHGEIDMAIQWFDGEPNLHGLVPFETNADELVRGIDNIHEDISRDSSTNLYGATIQGVDLIQGKVGTFGETVAVGSVVIFTDGKDQAARRTREEAVKTVLGAGSDVSVYTIGLGVETDMEALSAIGKDGFLFAQEVDDLVPLFEEIARSIRNDVNSHYLLEYCSPKRRGSHDLTLEIDYFELGASLTTCFCAEGFRGGCRVSPVP